MSKNPPILRITVNQAIALFESVGISEAKLVDRTRRYYRLDLVDLATFLAQQGITQLGPSGAFKQQPTISN